MAFWDRAFPETDTLQKSLLKIAPSLDTII